MRSSVRITLAMFLVAFPLLSFAQKRNTPAPDKNDDQNSLVITFKDGRQKTYSMADVARVEITTPNTTASMKGQGRFLGKWRVGDGAGSTFYITLQEDGVATKSIGSSHGTWTVVGNEARISWDDGWHDALRKNGSHYEKLAHSPGKTFTDEPDNVTRAELTDAQL